VGISVPGFDAPFMPCVEIGWRLAAEHWGKGLATETRRHREKHPRIARITRITHGNDRASHVGRQRRPTVRALERAKTQTSKSRPVCVSARSWTRAAATRRRATRHSSVSLCLCGCFPLCPHVPSVSLSQKNVSCRRIIA
jgi:hypothetical protein